MMRQPAHQPFVEQAHSFIFSNARPPAMNQLLLAIGRAMSPPVVHLRSTFHPMRVIVVQPDLSAAMNHAAEWGCETPRLLPSTLHSQQQVASETTRQHRAVQGEILSDESGKLYEKIGHHIRPVHQLASGPSGELVEIVPAERNNLRVISHPARVVQTAQQNPAEMTKTPNIEKNSVTSRNESDESDKAGHRKLFNDPGQWRVVTWGDFKEILAPQLAHPERLRDTYRLPCYVQVVETKRDVTIEELAKELSTAKGRPKPLYFLTDEIAAKLELNSLLPAAPCKPSGPRATNVLLAHERVFGMVAANDPTADVANVNKTEKAESSSHKSAPEKEAKLKTSIPDAFIKEWDFKLSRDEAVYELDRKSLFRSIRRLATHLRFVKLTRECRKWQVLLTGKSADEQLWSVRPPRNMLDHRFIREWVRRTLELAGYESEKMVIEWEIFWRRRGAQ